MLVRHLAQLRLGGTLPAMVSRRRFCSPSLGSERNSPRVYGCRGSAKSVRTSASSASFEAYITATTSAVSATTARSWVISSTDRPRRVLRSLIRSRIWAWMVTSSAVVGSSAISSSGSHDRAIAIITRWRIPPESWWGYSRNRWAGSGMPTWASISTARSRASLPESLRWRWMASTIWLPTVNTGFSEVIGSWKIIAIRPPRTRRISLSVSEVSGRSSSRISPPAIRPAGTHAVLSLGSSASRSRSPKMFSASTNRNMAPPAAVICHHRPTTSPILASLIICPQLGAPGMPRPR